MNAKNLEEILSAHSHVVVQQRKEWAEILIDWETANKYAVLDAAGGELAFVAERAGGLGWMLARLFLGNHRPFEIDVFDRGGGVLMHLSRPFFWFFSDLKVTAADGTPLGSVHRRFALFHKRYELRDESSQVFARIESPLWRLWTFPVIDTAGQAMATIAKQWGGLLREAFSDADTFKVDFNQETRRSVIFAAAISIDFDFFENNQKR